MTLLYGTCVAFGVKGILIRGASNSGKSDMALRLIDKGAMLIADDQVWIRKKGQTLYAHPPHNLKGLIEMRGYGILTLPYQEETALELIVHLTAHPPRLPQETSFMDVPIKHLFLHAFEASALTKIEMALHHGVLSSLHHCGQKEAS